MSTSLKSRLKRHGLRVGVSALALAMTPVVAHLCLRRGLAPLAAAEDLDRIADEHSGAMADVKRLSHEGFRSRLQRTRSSLCVENVAWNYRTPEALLDGWRASPAHHRNLLEPDVTRMGLATATRYVTFFACR